MTMTRKMRAGVRHLCRLLHYIAYESYGDTTFVILMGILLAFVGFWKSGVVFSIGFVAAFVPMVVISMGALRAVVLKFPADRKTYGAPQALAGACVYLAFKALLPLLGAIILLIIGVALIVNGPPSD